LQSSVSLQTSTMLQNILTVYKASEIYRNSSPTSDSEGGYWIRIYTRIGNDGGGEVFSPVRLELLGGRLVSGDLDGGEDHLMAG